MMKKSRDIEEPKQKSIAAAEHFESSTSIAPPSFTSSSMVAEQAVQAPQAAVQESENQEEIPEQDEQQGIATINPNKLYNAVANGHHYFKQVSTLANVSIQGSQAIGAAGCLKAPDVRSLIYADLSSELDTIENVKMAKAVSRVLGRFIDKWREGFIIPGVHWFPMFSYFPGPFAPPMPNVPTPLSATPSLFELYLTHKENMIQEIFNELPSEMDNDVNRSTIDSFSERTVNYFDTWLNSSHMLGLIGMGPVHGFNPPFSMGGPVMGHLLPKAGVLS